MTRRMRTPASGLALGLLFSVASAAPPQDGSLERLEKWLTGSFDTRAQAVTDRERDTPYKHDVALMSARLIDNPTVFGDGVSLYVENRIEGETRPYRQRVYRFIRDGARVRMEVHRIEGTWLGPLSLDSQAANRLGSGDLRKEEGCDVLLEFKAGEFTGATAAGSCKSAWKGSAYVTSSMRIGRDLVVTLDRGYDEKGAQTFGPTDGRGYEFRRVAK